MILQWEIEEKTLLNIKKITASVWCMNSLQIRSCHKKLCKDKKEILPGRLGNAFLKKLECISRREAGASTQIWIQLMQDTDHLLRLLHEYRNTDGKDWMMVLAVLEKRPERYFKTEMGTAFILVLKEKLEVAASKDRQPACSPTAYMDDKKELEETARWLMEDTHRRSVKTKKEKLIIFRDCMRRAAVPVLASLSVLFMFIWMRERIASDMDKWSLQQMKVPDAGRTDMFAYENQETAAEKEKVRLEKKAGVQSGRQTRPEKLPQYKKLSSEYPQFYGWLQIPDTQIDLPVMRAEEKSDFYLSHDFSGAQSPEGALFVDALSSIYPQDDNTVIYGHNMKNGHVFGTLKRYLDIDFFQDHREIRFDTVYETGIYEAVAVVKTRIRNENEQGFRYYQFYQYSSEEEFRECQDFVEENRIFETDSSLRYGDKILMLSTCEYSQENGRLVIVARKVDEAEKT